MVIELRKLVIEWNFLNMVNDIYGKTTASNVLSGERLRVFSLRSRTRYDCLLLPPVFIFVLEVLEQLDMKKIIKAFQSGKE